MKYCMQSASNKSANTLAQGWKPYNVYKNSLDMNSIVVVDIDSGDPFHLIVTSVALLEYWAWLLFGVCRRHLQSCRHYSLRSRVNSWT